MKQPATAAFSIVALMILVLALTFAVGGTIGDDGQNAQEIQESQTQSYDPGGGGLAPDVWPSVQTQITYPANSALQIAQTTSAGSEISAVQVHSSSNLTLVNWGGQFVMDATARNALSTMVTIQNGHREVTLVVSWQKTNGLWEEQLIAPGATWKTLVSAFDEVRLAQQGDQPL